LKRRSKKKFLFPWRQETEELKWNRVAGVFLDFYRCFLELSLHYFNWPTKPHCQSLSRPLSLDCAFLLTISSPSTATSVFVSRSSLVLLGFYLPPALHLLWRSSHSRKSSLGIASSKVRKDMRIEQRYEKS